MYFDNNSTTKCDPIVLEAMKPFLEEQYGNPSSIYSLGVYSKEKIQQARKEIADFLNADEDEIIFTSCASESNVCAILSAIQSDPSKKHIITTSVEHASIMETMKYLEQLGYDITYLSVDQFGRLDLQELRSSIRKDTLLIAVMMANNELGNIYPIAEISAIARENHILFHCDAVQAIGKMKIDLKELDIDTLSFSGHKIYAPKGIGILYVKREIPYVPLIFGHQEKNRRGGTENVPYIIGLGKAIELLKNHELDNQKIATLRDQLEEQLKTQIPDILVYGDPINRISNTLSIAFKGVKATELLLVLESFQIYVSTGSACNSYEEKPSYVLEACHADLDNYSPIRISLGRYNTEEEIEKLIKGIVKAVAMLRKKGSRE